MGAGWRNGGGCFIRELGLQRKDPRLVIKRANVETEEILRSASQEEGKVMIPSSGGNVKRRKGGA